MSGITSAASSVTVIFSSGSWQICSDVLPHELSWCDDRGRLPSNATVEPFIDLLFCPKNHGIFGGITKTHSREVLHRCDRFARIKCWLLHHRKMHEVWM